MFSLEKVCIAEEKTPYEVEKSQRHRENEPEVCIARCWECSEKKLYLYKF